ncbi:uncharacterized protein [Rutidosis leptorrhynchoides]|uniref:uncharacterized protein n=1 Tax=Rutidosis leptorrhynchoides TaxID=125765 RepID=UPI003A990182
MSPYLFTLVMEVLNLMIKRKIENDGEFKYHWGCEELKITHLCFADDLILFSNGDAHSVAVLRDALNEFSGASGLIASMDKSQAFYGNVKKSVQNDISTIMPFKVGELPIRYLGVPLLSTRLYAKDCVILVDKVKKRIFDWKNKSLSFAGRMQLVSSVLSSLQVFGLPCSSCQNRWCMTLKDQFIERRDLYNHGLDPNVSVADIILNGEWNLPNEFLLKFDNIFSQKPPLIMQNVNDRVLWLTKKGKKLPFTVKTVWDDICEENEVVKWSKLVWYSQSIPRHSFIVWVAILNKLRTQDKYMAGDTPHILCCPFCKCQKDSHCHLFFECSFPCEV